MLLQPHVQLVDMKRWADRGLCQAIARNLERLDRDEAAIMVRILDHFHVVDRIFQHHLQGLPHPYRAAQSETLPDLESLAEDIGRVDDWYGAYMRTLSADDLEAPVDFVFTSGRPARMRRSEIILHVCLHGTYHRGNAAALLLSKGLSTSRDTITDYLEDAA
jgi:uncharacterized damage-inducible protein DinB